MTLASEAQFGPWNPGIRSQVPRELQPLMTIYRPENVFTKLAEAEELRGLTGLDPTELVAYRPERLALHEVLVRVMADLSVPDGSNVEDLGINFRKITRTLLTGYVEPRYPLLVSAYDAAKLRITAFIDDQLASEWATTRSAARKPGRSRTGSFRALLLGRRMAKSATAPAANAPERPCETQLLAAWEARAASTADPLEAAACRALAKVFLALLVRHGRPWGGAGLIARLACTIACNEFGSAELGRLLEPWLIEGATREGYAQLPRQEQPVVMNTKGASASGKSTIRPLQRALAAEMGVRWSEFALVSPDIWRKQLLDYRSLGADYKYGAACTGDEVRVIDHKLDRYMARKARRGEMSHLMIDRFRFDSFAPDSDEAGSNLLTRFGHTVYLFLMITPPASLVERAWKRGLEVGRYKAVDDTLAHCVEAYAGMPELFFTWVRRADKQLHFEFLDNGVPPGARPRTVAFGSNDVLNVLDVDGLLNIERFRRININATAPDLLYADQGLLAAEHNTAFLRQCALQFREINFAHQASGRIFAQMLSGRPAWADRDALEQAAVSPDVRAGLMSIAPGLFQAEHTEPEQRRYLRTTATDRALTLGRWGDAPER